MRLRIDELPPEGLRLELDMERPWAAEAVAEALEGRVHELEGWLRVRAIAGGATVNGQAEALVEQRCGRCLAPLRLRLGGEIDLYYHGGRLEGDTSVALSEDDLDVGFLEEGVLDLGAALGEFFVLEAPTRLLCEDPGVQRVHPGPCELGEAVAEDAPRVDPRFAALENFSAD